MVLSETQKKILQAVLMRANVPDAEIARMLKLKQHTVRRSIKFFLESGIFTRRCVFVDPHALGLSNYLVRLSLPVGARKHYDSFVRTLVDAEETVGLVEFGGDRHLELRIYAYNANHLQLFLEKLAMQVKHPFYIEECFLILDQEYSGIFEKIPGVPLPSPLRFQPLRPGAKAAHLDEHDHTTLSALANERYLTWQDLARILKVPPSTLHYRIERLEKLGVIRGHYYVVDVKVFNDQAFSVYLKSKVLNDGEKEALRTFCRKHPRISWMSFFFGGKSAELMVRVENYRQAHEVVSDLSKECSDFIDTVEVRPLFHFYKFSDYPFRSYKTLLGEKYKA
ncbi:MAG: hypothetical protein RL417_2211 [Pseudomonadota bacterium]|jgi:DNA-binding Lrp family transcriptional regulator